MTEPRLWLVTWLDAVATNSWERREPAVRDAALIECQVVGRPIGVNKTTITVAGGWSAENDNVTGLHIIPRPNVVRCQLLKIGPTRKRQTPE